MIVWRVITVVRITNASKGLTSVVVLFLVLSIIIGAVIIIIITTQTDFIENAGLELTDLLSIKLP
jgi:hypothetical protein